MSQAFHKDILRSIKKGWKRFLSILIITALGVGMMTGLYAAGLDMYYSADQFFDRQNLFDIRILSTLGLTQEDVDVLARVDGVEAVEGGYIETVYTDINGVRKSTDMTVLSRSGINMPQLLAGALPTKPDEIAVTQKYLDERGKSIGDTLIIEEDVVQENNEESTKETPDNKDMKVDSDQGGSFNTDIDFDMDMEMELEEETEAPTFANTAYTITGVVLDPKDIRGNEDTGIVFRSTVTADYSFFITEEAASNDIFTVVYIILSITKEMNSYSDEYEDMVQSVINNIESRIKIQREPARYDAIISEAQAKIADAENTMNEKFAEADQKFADAWRDIYEARQELSDGEATLIDEQKDAEEKIVGAREKLENAKRKLADAEEELADGEERLAEAEAELLEGEQELADGEKKLLESEQELADGEKELLDGEQELADGKKELSEGEQELADGREELLDGEQELADGKKRLIGAGQQLADGEKQLAQGEAELNANAQKLAEGRQQLAEERKKALEQLAAAEQQLGAAQSQLDAARAQLESGIAQLRSAFGDAWPTDEWNALVNVAATLAAIGADDSAIVADIASESIALAAAMKAALMQQISQTQDLLDGLNQAIDTLDHQLVLATQQAADAQAGLSEKLAAADAAQSLLNCETEKLNSLEEGTSEYEAQQAVIANAQSALNDADAALAEAQGALDAENDAVTGLTTERDAQAFSAAELAAAIEQMNAQAEQLDALSASAAVEAVLGMGKVIGGQQALDAQKLIFAEQKAAALQELAGAEVELSAGEAKIEEARKTIEVKKMELEAGKAELAKGWAEWEDGRAKLAEGWAEWEDGRAKLDEGWAEWEDGRAKLDEGWAEWEDGKAELAEGWAEWEDGKAELAEGQAEWEDGKAELAEGRAELEDGKIELADGEAELKNEEADAKAKIGDAWDEIADGKQELADGEAELSEKDQEYAEKKEEAQQKLADAYAELDDIDMTRWYVQDRTSLESYSSLNSDLSSIEAVGRLFPIIFLLVAVLMSLTAMTRMVEEERVLIGTYKALGFGNASIYRKYILFAFISCLLGGVLGDIFGFVFMPRFISAILSSLYSLPQYYLRFDPLYGVGGVVLFMVAIVGATMLSCRNELRQMPAALLRPKAPRSGSRVWLERIPVVWNRLKFLNKVTVRNLFRYKKRLFMTIGGIMGCTALIICGFAIRDSVMKLSPNQYDNIYQYDLMAVFEEKDHDDMIRLLAQEGSIADYLNLRVESVKLFNANGESSPVQLMVIPNVSAIGDYIRMENPGGTPVHLDDGGVFITENATRILGLKIGDTISLQNLELEQDEATVSGIVKNYLGNNVYMTQKLYESLFSAYEPNGILAHLSDTCTDQAAYAEALLDNDSVLSAVSTAALRDDFGFDLLNAIVLLLIVLAGGLAFVVLFTLSTTNISERVRELATIKVLGFYDKEVYQYVNKETLILTVIGILIGLPAGRILSGFLIAALNMPSIHFAVYIAPVSYLFSAAITFGFAIIVNWMTNRTLDRINMVEALKSVE